MSKAKKELSVDADVEYNILLMQIKNARLGSKESLKGVANAADISYGTCRGIESVNVDSSLKNAVKYLNSLGYHLTVMKNSDAKEDQ